MPFARPTVHDNFTTSGVGDVYVLRLTGFLQETRGTLLDVSPRRAKVLVGGRTFGEWFRGDAYMPKTEVTLHFTRIDDGRTCPVDVEVEVRPRGLRPKNFDSLSKHLLRRVRAYFVVA